MVGLRRITSLALQCFLTIQPSMFLFAYFSSSLAWLLLILQLFPPLKVAIWLIILLKILDLRLTASYLMKTC